MPSAVAKAAGTDAGSVIGASSTIHTPSGNSLASSAATSMASRVFPTPPTPLSVTSRSAAYQLGQLGHLVLPADERAVLLGQVAHEVGAVPKHGELRRQAVGDDLVHRHASA